MGGLASDPITDARVRAVLDDYHQRIDVERRSPRIEAPGGRDGGQDFRMRAIGPETGWLLHALVGSLKAPLVVEAGTSFGYSTLWLADAARRVGGRVVTLELHGYKSDHARAMAEKAGLADVIDFRVGDAVAALSAFDRPVDFAFIDLWKDLYVPVLDALYPRLVPGAVIVADNMIRPGSEDIRRYGRRVRSLPGMRSLLLPVGTGIEVSRFEPEDAYAARTVPQL